MSLNDKLEIIKRISPQIWDMIPKKRFKKGVERFYDHKGIYLEFAIAMAYAVTKQEVTLVKGQEMLLAASAYLVAEKYKCPIFFVENGLLEAAIQSKINFTVDWQKMSFPFEGFTFVLPRSSKFTINGTPIAYIHITRTTFESNPLLHQTFFDKDKTGLIVFGLSPDLMFKPGFCTKNSYDPDRHEWKTVMDGEESSFSANKLEVLLHVAFNLIFAMAARPEYVETGRKIGMHKKSNSEIWTPNVIGRKYATKRVMEANTEKGTHSSPRMHWRRGHFRQQPYGKGLTEHKIIWLEPMLVNAEVGVAV